MATAQINTRINLDTKLAGDQALHSVGYSPTKAVRALWEFAARNRGNTALLKSTLDTLHGTANADDTETARRKRAQQAESIPLIFQNALEELGATTQHLGADVPYDDILAEAYDDKMAERGLAQ